jgi:hypothetical protein
MAMGERAFFNESQEKKPAELRCPFCGQTSKFELQWLVRRKKDRLPGNANAEDKAKFQRIQSYMVLLEDKVACKNLRCRKRFDVSGMKTMAFLADGVPRE